MIESVTISNTATFGSRPEELANLSQFNYIFGSNGTGKTTISRIIADQAAHPHCSVKWKSGRSLATVVLNRDFVEKNFGQLSGVFTLGEQHKDTRAKLADAGRELDKEHGTLETLTNTLQGQDGTSGKNGDLYRLEKAFEDKFWTHKVKYGDGILAGAFTGYRADKTKFKEKILDEEQANKASLQPLVDLERRARTVFGSAQTKELQIPTPDTAALLSYESNPLLKKRIVGKADVDIAAMIKRLENSDWVRQGRAFYEANNQVCPFCQQATSDALANSLADYFDEAFAADSNAIDALISAYTTDSLTAQEAVAAIISAPGAFVDVEKIKLQKSILDGLIAANLLVLDRKRKEPSQSLELRSTTSACAALKVLIDVANAKITAHNRMIDNAAAEKRELTAQVWRFVLTELSVDLAQYRDQKEALDKAIGGLRASIDKCNARVATRRNEIAALEREAASIQPTVDGINAILARFGFDSFSLATSADKTSYRLVRHTGEDAKDTLSDGEKTFVVFLYFYHLLSGSMSESGITTDRVVVFDDPVSSLDSDVLFVVSSLIKRICDEARHNRGHIKQIFVLTHNVYFHREVTFNSRRNKRRLTEESFWIVRKVGALSKIEEYQDNPIKTSYELLWTEVREADPANPRIENTLRRIVEHYFMFMGPYPVLDNLCAQFDGQEQFVCKSLLSWVNAGSHHAHDDAHFTPSTAMVPTYLKVFRAIFDKTCQSGHYRMMMGLDLMEDPIAIAGAPSRTAGSTPPAT